MAAKIKYLYDQDIDYVPGFHAFSVNSGIKKDKPDTAIMLMKTGATVGGVFSKNLFRSSSLDNAKKKLKNTINALAVFSGNANACTGPHGEATNKALSNAIAKAFGCKDTNVLMSFTGVVGREFPYEKILTKVVDAVEIESGKPGTSVKRLEWDTLEFSKGILTTDTKEKKIACEVTLNAGKKFRMSACAKGAGMIHPNMATMLAYITTDLQLKGAECQKILGNALADTFHMVTVDGDTSTNDSCFFLASGKSGVAPGPAIKMDEVQEIVNTLCKHLAREVARDGEGATKLITVRVEGAKTVDDARKAAKAVACSLLVKTAVFGGDPNYGRILVSLGNTGLSIKPEAVELTLGKIPVFKSNKVQTNQLPKAASYLKDASEVEIILNLHQGKATAEAWTCDISYDYVKINAEYTT